MTRHGVLVEQWQRDVWRELTSPLQAALDEVTSLVADARERAAFAAWVLTDPDRRDSLVEIIDDEHPPRFTVEHEGDVLRVECDPPCYACRLG